MFSGLLIISEKLNSTYPVCHMRAPVMFFLINDYWISLKFFVSQICLCCCIFTMQWPVTNTSFSCMMFW